MAERNDRLRRARQHVESPHASGDHLSRQELAELVNAWVYEHTGRVIELDANYVGKLEQGTIRWMRDAERRAAFRAVLGVRTDAELGLRRPRRTRTTVDDVDRQQFLRLGLGAGAAAAGLGPSAIDELLTPAESTTVPSTVGMSHVADVRATAKAFEGWDLRYGSGLVREAVSAQLRHCAQLLDAHCSGRVRAELASAVGDFADTAGYMAFDAYAHEDARRLFRFALLCADAASDWHLRAKVLWSMARQAVWRDDPDSGLTLIEHAMVRSDRLTATERAIMHTGRAHALARLGRTEDTIAAVGAADEEFANRHPDADPPSITYYTDAMHAGDTGRAFWTLAVSGRRGTDVMERLNISIAGHGAGRARMRSQVKLASLVMATGDPAEATELGLHALDAGTGVRSRRAADDLRELRQLCEPHRRRADVAELRNRIGNATAELT